MQPQRTALSRAIRNGHHAVKKESPPHVLDVRQSKSLPARGLGRLGEQLGRLHAGGNHLRVGIGQQEVSAGQSMRLLQDTIGEREIRFGQCASDFAQLGFDVLLGPARRKVGIQQADTHQHHEHDDGVRHQDLITQWPTHQRVLACRRVERVRKIQGPATHLSPSTIILCTRHSHRNVRSCAVRTISKIAPPCYRRPSPGVIRPYSRRSLIRPSTERCASGCRMRRSCRRKSAIETCRSRPKSSDRACRPAIPAQQGASQPRSSQRPRGLESELGCHRQPRRLVFSAAASPFPNAATRARDQANSIAGPLTAKR